jgi:hypothetical protein
VGERIASFPRLCQTLRVGDRSSGAVGAGCPGQVISWPGHRGWGGTTPEWRLMRVARGLDGHRMAGVTGGVSGGRPVPAARKMEPRAVVMGVRGSCGCGSRGLWLAGEREDGVEGPSEGLRGERVSSDSTCWRRGSLRATTARRTWAGSGAPVRVLPGARATSQRPDRLGLSPFATGPPKRRQIPDPSRQVPDQ